MNLLDPLEDFCIHEKFHLNALERPNAIAIIYGNQSLTYAELNQKAEQKAKAFKNSGIMPRSFIPILLPRSPELIISILAVLKSGAAYALLDPSWPESRLRDVIEILGASFVITNDVYSHIKIPNWHLSPNITTVASDFLSLKVTPDSPSCVFFTSGTTGPPKGVVSPHHATTRLFKGESFAHFSHSTVIPLAAALPWDAFSLELWGALLNGGTVWLPDEPYLSGDALRKGISDYKINTVWMTSSLFNMVVEEDLNAFSGLQQVIIGGERLSVPHVEKFLKQYPVISLINGYGPVESTVFATTHHITLQDCSDLNGIPIGKPVPLTNVYIVKEAEICAEGQIGEICISGNGLAIGYIKDPTLTEEKFTQIKINEKLVRLYRTGDLGFWQNSLLYYKGRIDRQIKIRGHRVELAEVEQQILNLLPEARACRVIAQKKDSDGTHELIAFCIPIQKDNTLDNAITILRTHLVSYQCPTKLLSIQSFPLTQQGKLDEQHLLSMLQSENTLKQEEQFLTHENSLITLVSDTFALVLGRAVVSLDNSFQELGGTSLDAGRICARLSKKLKLAIPVSWLYQHTSVSALSKYLQGINNICNENNVDKKLSYIPLNAMQILYLTRYLANPKDLTSHCLMTWLIHGELDQKALQTAIEYVHNRHEGLRVIYTLDPVPSIKSVDIMPPLLEVYENQDSIDQALDLLKAEFGTELDVCNGDVWRIAVIPLNKNQEFILACLVHHITFDGHSESILADDLSYGYNVARGTKVPSASQPISLRDAYSIQSSYLSQAKHLDYNCALTHEFKDVPIINWSDSLKHGDPLKNNEILVTLDRELVLFLNEFARKCHATRFEVLLALWGQTIAKVTEQNDFCIGVPIRQRFTAELESSIGCHINMICVRMRGKSLATGLEGIIGTKQIIQRMFAMQEITIENLLQLSNSHKTDRPPLFQTLFALQDSPIPNLQFTNLKATFIRQPYFELPLELHAEVWPQENGELHFAISCQPGKVPSAIVHKLANYFKECLDALLVEQVA